MTPLKNSILALVAVFVFLVCGAAFPQGAPLPITVYGPVTRDTGALKTFTAQGAATVSSADQTGFNVSRVVCVYNQTATSGSPSVTFNIQNKDKASGLYYTLVTSAAVSSVTSNAPSFIAAGAGIATTSNVSANVPIAALWRTQVIVAGSSTPTVTGTVGCAVQ